MSIKHAEALIPEDSFIRRFWDRFSDYAIVAVILLALGGIAFGVYSAHSSDNNSAAAAKSSAAAETYAKQSVAYQQQVIALEEEIKYIAGVVAFEGGVIEQSLSEHSGELGDIAAVQKQQEALSQEIVSLLGQVPSITAALQGGQEQLLANGQTVAQAVTQLESEVASLATQIGNLQSCVAANSCTGPAP